MHRLWEWLFGARYTPRAGYRPITLTEICETTIAHYDLRYPRWQRIGPRGVRKAALAGQRAKDAGGDLGTILDAIERSIKAQYASRAYVSKTDPAWIDKVLPYA